MRAFTFILVALAVFQCTLAAKDPNECEVCKTVVDKVRAKISESDRKDLVQIENAIGKYCEKPANEKEIKLCYYIDPIKRELSQPLKNGVPTDVVCQRLKKKSAEICALRYAASTSGETITASSDFSKMRISQLKSFMAEKNIECPECIEKDDFVRIIKTNLGMKDGL